jgi:ribosomal protein S5
MIGSSNKVNNVMATYLALTSMRTKEQIQNAKKDRKLA